MRRLEFWLSVGTLALLLPYWFAWSVVGPVTNGDSQVYNLARLWVVNSDRFFFNQSYASKTQLILPWSFDAVHYPFLFLRYGAELPVVLTATRGRVFHIYDQLQPDLIAIRNASDEDLERLDRIHGRGEYRLISIGAPDERLTNAVCEPVDPPARGPRWERYDFRYCVWRRR